MAGKRSPRRAQLVRFTGALAAVALMWLAVLPWIASRPATAAYLDWLEKERIDPSAMYYTDLEMMEPILTRLALEERKGRDFSNVAQVSGSTDSARAGIAETGQE